MAVRSSGVEEDRTGVVLDQLALDFPDNLLSLLRVRLRRLLVHQLVDFGIAIAGIVARGAAYIILIERHIRIVDCRLGDIDRDLVILAHQLRIPLGGIDWVEFRVDVDLLQLPDQNHCGIAIGLDVACGHRQRQSLIGAIAQFLHHLARLRAAARNVRVIAWQVAHCVRRHTPYALGRRLHDATDRSLSVGDDVDKRLAVEGQRHRATQFGAIERRHVAVDEQVAADIRNEHVADRLRTLVFCILQLWHCDAEIDVLVARDEGEQPGRHIFDDPVFDAIEVRPLVSNNPDCGLP